MPKKNKQIGLPVRGMNNYADSRDVPDGHFADLDNANVDIPGRIQTGGRLLPGPYPSRYGNEFETGDDYMPDLLPQGNGGLSTKDGEYFANVSGVTHAGVDGDEVTIQVLGQQKWDPDTNEMRPTGFIDAIHNDSDGMTMQGVGAKTWWWPYHKEDTTGMNSGGSAGACNFDVQLVAHKRFTNGGYSIVVNKPIFTPGMQGGYIMGSSSAFDGSANQGGSAGWQNNKAKIMGWLAPNAVIVSNEITVESTITDTHIWLDWSPAYHEIQGDLRYTIKITNVDTTNHEVNFMVDYGTKNQSWEVDKPYYMTLPENHWQVPSIMRTYQNPEIPGVEQDIRNARKKGIRIVGNDLYCGTTGATHLFKGGFGDENGADDSAQSRRRYSDWYRIDHGIYIRFVVLKANTKFSNAVTEGALFQFDVNSALNLARTNSGLNYVQDEVGGRNWDYATLKKSYANGYHLSGQGVKEFRMSTDFSLSESDNVVQTALVNKGNVFVYSPKKDTSNTFPNTGWKHGWRFMGKSTHETGHGDYRQTPLELHARVETAYTANFTISKDNHDKPNYPVNPFSIRFIRIDANGKKMIMPYCWGASEPETLQTNPFGASIWAMQPVGTITGGVLSPSYSSVGKFFGYSQISDKGKKLALTVDYNGGHGATFSDWGVNERTDALSVGESLVMLAESENHDRVSEDVDINVLNGRLRVSSTSWPFRGSTWWIGYQKGLNPYVYNDFHASPNTEAWWPESQSETSTLRTTRVQQIVNYDAGAELGPCNMQEVLSLGYEGDKKVLTTQRSNYQIMERDAVIPQPEGAEDGMFCSMPGDFRGQCAAVYGNVMPFTIGNGPSSGSITPNPDNGVPYLLPLFRAERKAESHTNAETAHPDNQAWTRSLNIGYVESGHAYLPTTLKWAKIDDGAYHRKFESQTRWAWNFYGSFAFHRDNQQWMKAANEAAAKGNPYIILLTYFFSRADDLHNNSKNNGPSTGPTTPIADTSKATYAKITRHGMGWNCGNTEMDDWVVAVETGGTYNYNGASVEKCGYANTPTPYGSLYYGDYIEGQWDEDATSPNYKRLKAHYVRIKEVMPNISHYTMDQTAAVNNLWKLHQTWFGNYWQIGDYDFKSEAEQSSDTGDNEFDFIYPTSPSGVEGFTCIIPEKDDVLIATGSTPTHKTLLPIAYQFMGFGIMQYKILPPAGGGIAVLHHGQGTPNNVEQNLGAAAANFNGTESSDNYWAEKTAPQIFWKGDRDYQFGITYIDSNENESNITTHDEFLTIHLKKHYGFRPGLALHGPFPGWVRKIRIYVRVKGSKDEAWAIFIETDMKEVSGYVDSNNKVSNPLMTFGHGLYQGNVLKWANCGVGDMGDNSANYEHEIAFTEWGEHIPKMNAATYRLLNGFRANTEKRIVGWGLSALVNGILIVAKVRTGDGKLYNDNIYWSPKFKKPRYDNLHLDSAIPLDDHDGDNIIEIASYRSTLLVFKRYSIHVITFANIQKVGTVEVLKQGIYSKGSCVQTDYGVIWINKGGMYLYGKEGMKHLSKGKLNGVWFKDFMEANLESMSYKSNANPYPSMYYDYLSRNVVIFPGGGWIHHGGKCTLRYNIILGSFTFTTDAIMNEWSYGDNANIDLNTHITDDLVVEDNKATSLQFIGGRHFYSHMQSKNKNYWDKHMFQMFYPQSKGNSNEFRALTNNVTGSYFPCGFRGIQWDSPKATESGTTYGFPIRGQLTFATYTDADIMIDIWGFATNELIDLMPGDYVVLRSSASTAQANVANSSPYMQPIASMQTNGVEEIMQIRQVMYGTSTYGAVNVKRGCLGTTAKAFTNPGYGQYTLMRLSKACISGAYYTYDINDKVRLGGRDLTWETMDIHMATNETYGNETRSEATRKRFYKFVVTYKNGGIQQPAGNDNVTLGVANFDNGPANSVASHLTCYFQVDGKDFVIDADHEMVTKAGFSAFNHRSEDWITEELYPKEKTLCKNNYSIRFKILDINNSHYAEATSARFQDDFGVLSSRADWVGVGKYTNYEHIRSGQWRESVSKDATGVTDLVPIQPGGGGVIGNGVLVTTQGSGGNQIWDWDGTNAAWFSNPETCLYQYTPGNPLHNQVVALIQGNASEQGYLYQRMDRITQSANNNSARVQMMEGKTYRFECHVIVDRNHQIQGYSQNTDERLPHYMSTYGGRNTPDTQLVAYPTAIEEEVTKKGNCVGAEVRITDADALANIAGNNEARWILPETGKYVWYWTVPSSNKKWNPSQLHLWLLPDTSHEPSAGFKYTIVERISVREIENHVPGEFEVNDMNVIYREKTVK